MRADGAGIDTQPACIVLQRVQADRVVPVGSNPVNQVGLREQSPCHRDEFEALGHGKVQGFFVRLVIPPSRINGIDSSARNLRATARTPQLTEG